MGEGEDSQSERAREVDLQVYGNVSAPNCNMRDLHGFGTLPVGARVSGESIVTINLGETERGSAWRDSHAAVL